MCPDIVTVSPTANPLAPAVCITVVLVVLDAVLDVTAVVMDGAVDAPLLLLPVQSVSSIFVVIGSLPEGQRRDSHPGPVKNTSKKKRAKKNKRCVHKKCTRTNPVANVCENHAMGSITHACRTKQTKNKLLTKVLSELMLIGIKPNIPAVTITQTSVRTILIPARRFNCTNCSIAVRDTCQWKCRVLLG